MITLSLPMSMKMFDGVPIDEACKRLEDAGADVVGLNCGRGPATMIEPLKVIQKACKVNWIRNEILYLIFDHVGKSNIFDLSSYHKYDSKNLFE